MKSVLVTIFTIVLFFIASVVSAGGIIFSDLTISKVKIKFKDEANKDKFEIKGEFKLGQGNNGIAPKLEGTVIMLGNSVLIIPPKSFVKTSTDEMEFKGIINTVNIEMEIKETSMDSFEFEVEAENVQLTRIANPVNIELFIGDDTGNATVKLKGELEK